jgi:hypothetical protein
MNLKTTTAPLIKTKATKAIIKISPISTELFIAQS